MGARENEDSCRIPSVEDWQRVVAAAAFTTLFLECISWCYASVRRHGCQDLFGFGYYPSSKREWKCHMRCSQMYKKEMSHGSRGDAGTAAIKKCATAERDGSTIAEDL